MESSVRYQKGPLSLSVDVTYKCTLRCLHCFNLSGEQAFAKEITDEEFMDLCTEILDMRPGVICFCGGEPLLRKELLYKACKYLTTESNKNIVVNMVSNGELLTKEVAENIKKAGFTNVQISLDGAKAETHDWLRNKPGAFDKAIQAIKNLVEQDVKVGVACTPSLKNISEMDEVIALCESLGVNNFRVQPLMLLGRAPQNVQDYIPKYNDYRKLATKLIDLKYRNASLNKMQVDWGDPVDHLIRSKMRNNGYLPFVSISAYGYINLSPYIPFTVGDLKKHSFQEYWNSGLRTAWTIPLFRELADLVKSTERLGLQFEERLPKIYFEDGIHVDLIDDREELEGLTLDNLAEYLNKKNN